MNFEPGGITKACLELVKFLSADFEIDICAMNSDGYYKHLFSKYAKVIELNKVIKILGVSQSKCKKYGIFWFFLRAFFALWAKLFSNKLIYKFCFKFQRKFIGYDIAVAYAQNGSKKQLYGGVPEFILNKFPKSFKISFIHDDFIREEYHSRHNINLYNKFDVVCTLSNSLRDYISLFIKKTKIISIPNILDIDDIYEKSLEYYIQKDSKITFLTVARLNDEKGLLRCVNAFFNTGRKDFKWIIVGDGKLRNSLNELIVKLKLSNNIYLVGNKNNPYPFYLACDYYLMCSHHEALPVVVDEAHAFNKIVVSTKYISCNEQLFKEDIICENSINGLTNIINYVLNSDKKKILNNKGKTRLEDRIQKSKREYTRLFIDK